MRYNQKKITERFDYALRVPEIGIYSISIAARCHSGEQTGTRGGENLRVEIDGRAFREIPSVSKPQYQDIPASWNGTLLKGAKQTVIFILYLRAGEHTITFIPQEGASIEREPVISLIQDLSAINFDPEEQAEDGDRRPWFTFAFIDLPLASFSIDASTRWHWRDGDDIKLIIDGEIQKNTSPLSVFHRNWLWSSFPFQNERQEKTFTPALLKGIHYVELWADRTPTLHRAKFNASQSDASTNVHAKVVWESAKLRMAPHIAPTDLGSIAKDERLVILEKAVVGDRIVTPSGNVLTTDRWHKVRYKNQEGYIYSLALEIDAEDKQSIRELIIQKSQEIGEDHCLMLAVAQRESKFFPYEVSDKGAWGVFQLKEDAVTDVNATFRKNFSDRFDMLQNIEAGILYFQIVKKRYEGKDYFEERCLAAWNRGWRRVNPDKPFLLAHQPIATRQFIHDVFRFRDACKRAGGVLLRALFLTMIVLAGIYGLMVWRKAFFKQYAIPDVYARYVVLADQKVDIDADGNEERLTVLTDNPHSTFNTIHTVLIRRNNSFMELPDKESDELQWIKTGDFNHNGKTDIAVLYGYSGSAGFGHFYLYEWDNAAFKTLLAREEINSEVVISDLDDDGAQEIVYRFSPSKWGRKDTEVYQWQKQEMRYSKVTHALRSEKN